jgi:hypothetical protein
MTRYVFRFSGPAGPREDQERIRSFSKVHVVDQATRMFLIEGPDADVQALAKSLPGWTVTPEKEVALPDARAKTRRSKKARG